MNGLVASQYIFWRKQLVTYITRKRNVPGLKVRTEDMSRYESCPKDFATPIPWAWRLQVIETPLVMCDKMISDLTCVQWLQITSTVCYTTDIARESTLSISDSKYVIPTFPLLQSDHVLLYPVCYSRVPLLACECEVLPCHLPVGTLCLIGNWRRAYALLREPQSIVVHDTYRGLVVIRR